tara:strand:- start:381 stop:1904 length:1524 start_codon:yes stop_codon:yes gene_type:complete
LWGKILNNITIISLFTALLFLASYNSATYAFPEYTSRQKALKLAEVLEKGYFKSIKISSVFVKNIGKDDYYLQALLSDGSSRKWFLNRIHEWLQTDELILSNNRALVFPSNATTDFGVLEKNDFYRTALNATAYVKTFGKHDVLEGKSLVLGILRFRILQEDDSKFLKTNKKGDRYRYVLELENGTHEYLTYTDAFLLMQRSALLEEVPETVNVLRKSYKVKGMKKITLQLEDELREIWRFGIEVVFDKPVMTDADKFPYRFVEVKKKDPNTGRLKSNFFLHIIFPNAEKRTLVRGFKKHEYLHQVKIETDKTRQKRVILKAMVDPDVIDLPPYVEVTDRNSVVINYYSSKNRNLTQPPDLPVTQSPSEVPRSVFTPEKIETEFEKKYMKVLVLIRDAQQQPNMNIRINTYFKALEELKKASLSAEDDIQITQALNQRDVLLITLPKLIIRNVQMTILAKKLDQQGTKADPELSRELLAQLAQAERYAFDEDQQHKIASLQNILRYQ